MKKSPNSRTTSFRLLSGPIPPSVCYRSLFHNHWIWNICIASIRIDYMEHVSCICGSDYVCVCVCVPIFSLYLCVCVCALLLLSYMCWIYNADAMPSPSLCCCAYTICELMLGRATVAVALVIPSCASASRELCSTNNTVVCLPFGAISPFQRSLALVSIF